MVLLTSRFNAACKPDIATYVPVEPRISVVVVPSNLVTQTIISLLKSHGVPHANGSEMAKAAKAAVFGALVAVSLKVVAEPKVSLPGTLPVLLSVQVMVP